MKNSMELKISDVDDSGDILFPMLLHGWIRFSPIVSLLHLISYTFIIQYVYKFRCCFLELRNGTELWATCWRFYTCLPQGIYIASQSNSVCLHYIVCSYNIGYACQSIRYLWIFVKQCRNSITQLFSLLQRCLPKFSLSGTWLAIQWTKKISNFIGAFS